MTPKKMFFRGVVWYVSLLIINCSSKSDIPSDLSQELIKGVETEDAFDVIEESDNISPASLINPFIGTGGSGFNIGSGFPGATLPFGMVKVGPDTWGKDGAAIFSHCAGYYYHDEYILGFSHNHLYGTGVPDYGNITVRPIKEMTKEKTHRLGYMTLYDRSSQEASPGYYAVTLSNPDVRVEVTATERCAIHRYTFMEGTNGVVLLDASSTLMGGKSKGGMVKVDIKNREVYGWNHNEGEFSGRYGGFRVYFMMRFREKFESFGVFENEDLRPDVTEVLVENMGQRFGAWFVFDLSKDNKVVFTVCLSYTGIDGALKAMETEASEDDFDQIREKASNVWNKEMSRIRVSGGSYDEKVIFYTALYHTMQMPTIWSDVDGSYMGFDGAVHKEQWTYYTDMSFWDTFRTQHPLLTLLIPERQRDMMRSLVKMNEQGGFVPKWPMGMGDTTSMIGQHGASVVADSIEKGVTDFDVKGLYSSLRSEAECKEGFRVHRECCKSYISKGYCPSDEQSGSVSVTLEYAFNDYCLGRIAEYLGLKEDAVKFYKRAKNYVNLWDNDTGFFRPRKKDGSFVEPFDPLAWSLSGGDYVEATPWQYLWFVPHDVEGLIGLFGGSVKFIQRLQDFFQETAKSFIFEVPSPYYYHGNEPDIHSPFLFIEANAPEETQRWSRWVIDNCYKNSYDGMIGNDDAGTLAAWYVFSAIGIFPIPCTDQYYITAPIFDKTVMQLGEHDLVIEAKGAEKHHSVIKEVRWNGNTIKEMKITHGKLIEGGILEIVLGE